MSVARHTAYNFIGAVIPLAVAVVTVPLYLKVIGLDRYGVLAICWVLVGYFGLFDLGLGRAVAQRIATLADATPEKRSSAFWTAAALSSALALVAVALFVPFVTFGLGMMNLPSAALRGEVQWSIPWLVAAVPLGIAQSLLIGALSGRSEFGRINLVTSIGTVGTAVLPLAVAQWLGPQLVNLLASSLAVRALMLVALAAACRQTVPLKKPRLASPSERTEMLKFGGWATVTSIVGPLLVYLDRFVIGAMLSSAAVALYVVPFQIVGYLSLLPNALASAIFPRLAAASTDDAVRLGRQGLLLTGFAATPLAMIAAVAIEPFFKLWIGASAAEASIPVALLLLLGVWANSLTQIPFVRLQAMGRPDLIAMAHVAEILPYLCLLYFGLVHFGIAGAALAWSARCFADAFILTSLARLTGPATRILLAYIGLLAAVILILFLFESWNAWRWLALGLVSVAAMAILWRHAPPQVQGEWQKMVKARRVRAGT
jgi:O-antigen/teichoic acid export membrane protein